MTQKYGRDQVAQIITFETMACKAAIKDSGRAMDIPYPRGRTHREDGAATT